MTTQTITIDWLKEQNACREGTVWFRRQDKTDPLAVLRKLRGDHWDWYLWLAPRLMTHQQKVLWACFCAEQVLPIFEKKRPGDERPRKAIEAARKSANDPSEVNPKAAANAYAAAHAAYTAAAYAAAYAAYAAANADAYAAYAAANAAADAVADAEKMRNLCADEAERILTTA